METDRIVAELLTLQGVQAVIEFGSTARDGDDSGDVDLLVVVDDDTRRRQVVAMADRLSTTLGLRVSPSVFTADALASRLDDAPSFGAHLRDEGRMFGMPAATQAVASMLERVEITPETLDLEFAALAQRLHRLRDRSRFADSYGTALGRLYAIGRAASILQLMREGETDYDWRTAFGRLARRRPDFRRPLDVVAALRPYYDALDGRIDVDELGLDRPVLRHEYEKSLDAVATLTAGARDGRR